MIKELLGIAKLEKRMLKIETNSNRFHSMILDKLENIEKRISKLETHNYKPEKLSKDKNSILKALREKAMTTKELSIKLDKHRSWISLLVNELEKQGKVYEKSKRGRSIVYALK